MGTLMRVVIALFLFAGSFAGGLYLGRGQVEKVIVEKEGREKLVYRDRIVTVTRTIKPDGTVTETTKTEDRSGKSDTRTTDKSTKQTPVLAQWRAGVAYRIDYENPLDKNATQIEAVIGRRLVGPLWVEIQAGRSSASLGLGLEF